jgi:pimeloyl-ACP methyl ester carboxylesterase
VSQQPAHADRVVVLLHAFPLDSSIWDGVVGPVVAAGWAVVTPDLRGFGASRYGADGPDDEPSLAAMARDVIAVLDRLGAASAVVGGVSMGGYVAMELLRQAPDRVDALVLVDTKPGADPPAARENRLRIADEILATSDTVALADAMLPTLLGPTTRATRPDVVQRVRRLVEAADPAGVAWAQRAMAVRPDSLSVLAGYPRPALIVWGDEDALSTRADQDAMVDALADVHLAVVGGAGHLAVLEAPDAVADAVVGFLGTRARVG